MEPTCSAGVLVGADRETSSGVRYKYGRNLNSKEKNALIIRKPSDYRLPDLVHQTNYLTRMMCFSLP